MRGVGGVGVVGWVGGFSLGCGWVGGEVGPWARVVEEVWV